MSADWKVFIYVSENGKLQLEEVLYEIRPVACTRGSLHFRSQYTLIYVLVSDAGIVHDKALHSDKTAAQSG